MPRKYHHIVVGSGISGMTTACLLARTGRKVLLLEKAAAMGGSMIRFYRNGIPFDTGFHFTGGFGEAGLLTMMLETLGINDAIRPLYLAEQRAQRIIMENSGKSYDLPSGISAIRAAVASYFPEERPAIDLYFDKLTEIFDSSARVVFEEGDQIRMPFCPEDNISLLESLDKLTSNQELKSVLSIFCMCYGAKPSEVSFAVHSRVCFSLFESLARVERGGEAFIRAFRSQFKALGVDVRCNTHVVRCGPVENKAVHRFILNTGEEVEFDSAVFTVHPKEILKVLPKESLRPEFIRRVGGYEDSAAFFSIFATVDEPEAIENVTITSLLPSNDMDDLLTLRPGVDSALVLVRAKEQARGKEVQTLAAFEPVSASEAAQWENTNTWERPASYVEYKARRAQHILERIYRSCPEYRGRLKLIDSASTLTFRDWLNSPTGAAYGIKQKVGQRNVIGRLPFSNLYAAGQSALLPGIVGAMMSAFVVCRGILGLTSYATRSRAACA